jgi:ribonuclease VapC
VVVDTSALLAIVLGEPLADVLGPMVLESPSIIAAPSVLEAHLVLRKYLGDDSSSIIARFIADLDITIREFSAEHAGEAARAFDRFGKGHHPSALNFGDCMAYALAKVSGQALLFTGADFSDTDVLQALRL